MIMCMYDTKMYVYIHWYVHVPDFNGFCMQCAEAREYMVDRS